MTEFKQVLRAAAVLAVALTIGGCATQMTGPSSRLSPAQAATRAAQTSQYKEAVRNYLRAADQASEPAAKRQFQFEAGLAAAQGGDAQTARKLLSGINPNNLSKTDKARYNLAQREIDIANLPPARGLAKLPLPARNTPPQVAQRVWEKRADLYFAGHNPVQGIHALVQRDTWLKNARALKANDKRIYEKSLDAVALGIGPNSRAASGVDETTRGWLALANIGQRHFPDQKAQDKALANWQAQYPGHPANRSILKEQFNYQGATGVTRGQHAGAFAPASNIKSPQVAIALPLSGQYKNVAQAIRDGFLFAYQNNPGGMPKPLIYDSNSMSPQALASKAQSSGVGILVGPLLKSKVAALARVPTSLPVIALNISPDATLRRGFYQFGLTPEDDARSAAAHAAQSGYHNALALVPSGDWGNRILDAFRQALSAVGGHLVDYQTYDGNGHDHSRAIKALLRNKGSADFIFVAAQPVQARLIRSQLKYYDAGDLPMVATSSAYGGTAQPKLDIDLDDVHFVDIPWLLGTGNVITQLRTAASKEYGDEAKHYARPFAFGMDGWLLARRLYHGHLSKNEPVEGMTGILTVDSNGHISRYLGWAVFRDGEAHTLAMPSVGQANQLAKALASAASAKQVSDARNEPPAKPVSGNQNKPPAKPAGQSGNGAD